MFNDYKNLNKRILVVKKALEEAIDVHFGVSPRQVSEKLISDVAAEIIEKMGRMCVDDIDYAFERSLSKKSSGWRNITKKDVIVPLRQWNAVKYQIARDYKKFEAKKREKEISDRKFEEFKSKSVSIYASSLNAGEWLGDIFNAKAVAPMVAQKISDSDKSIIWKKSQSLLNETIGFLNTESIFITVTDKLIYSEQIVVEGIKRKISI